jgi:hypothetical protein
MPCHLSSVQSSARPHEQAHVHTTTATANGHATRTRAQTSRKHKAGEARHTRTTATKATPPTSMAASVAPIPIEHSPGSSPGHSPRSRSPSPRSNASPHRSPQVSPRGLSPRSDGLISPRHRPAHPVGHVDEDLQRMSQTQLEHGLCAYVGVLFSTSEERGRSSRTHCAELRCRVVELEKLNTKLGATATRQLELEAVERQLQEDITRITNSIEFGAEQQVELAEEVCQREREKEKRREERRREERERDGER